jgi:hypothetical protein
MEVVKKLIHYLYIAAITLVAIGVLAFWIFV